MKNPLKSRHLLFRVHRVYGIQNDRLDLTVNEFLTVSKTPHSSKDIHKNVRRKNSKNWKYLRPRCIVFPAVIYLLIVRLRRSFSIPLNL